MRELRVRDELRLNYDAYSKAREADWRRLGALEKGENVVKLYVGIPSDTALEFEVGEGAVLQRLSELGFGAVLREVEISSSGVDNADQRRIPRLAECRLLDGYNRTCGSNSFNLAILTRVLKQAHKNVSIESCSENGAAATWRSRCLALSCLCSIATCVRPNSNARVSQ